MSVFAFTQTTEFYLYGATINSNKRKKKRFSPFLWEWILLQLKAYIFFFIFSTQLLICIEWPTQPINSNQSSVVFQLDESIISGIPFFIKEKKNHFISLDSN